MAVDAIDDFATRYPQDARVADLKAKRGEMRESIANQRLATARFYEKRRQYSSARIYYEMLEKDFSDTGAAQTAKAWLDNNAAVTHVGMKYGKQEAK